MSNQELIEELKVKEDHAYRAMMCAASCLAYDVTFRADKPNGPGHDKASPRLTQRLRTDYIEASRAYDKAQAEVDAHR